MNFRMKSQSHPHPPGTTLLVVNNPKNWPIELPGVEVVSAKQYLTDPDFGYVRRTKVYNLCRSYSYQSQGYYVSLLAEARGHRPLPSIQTVQELRNPSVLRLRSLELDKLIQSALKSIVGDEFILSIYFGRNLAQRYGRLALALYNAHPAPLLRARFERLDGRWRMDWLRPVPTSEIPDSHRSFLVKAVQEHLGSRSEGRTKRAIHRYDLAILVDPKSDNPPSDERALRKFERAGNRARVRVERITPNDAGRLLEFDGLFIRETTQVDHYTYRFAVRAEAAGMVVVDDPGSIVRCTNKVFLAEALLRHKIPAPRSMVVHDGNAGEIAERLGFPVIVKQPDSSFSQGVFKVGDETELAEVLSRLHEDSDLLIAQEFLPSEFDWRIGVLGGKPLYACRYYMAHKHWQIIQWQGTAQRFGKVEALPVDQVPDSVMRNALRAARLMGDGLYGVDLKQRGNRSFVIEVNDNPSLEAGDEDQVMGDELYDRIIDHFVRRIESSRSMATARQVAGRKTTATTGRSSGSATTGGSATAARSSGPSRKPRKAAKSKRSERSS